VDPLRPYVAALDGGGFPGADFQWTSQHSARVVVENLGPGDVISIQEAWHKGWHATANGRPIEIHRDAIGLMYLEPDPSSTLNTIEMVFDGGMEARVARWLSIGTLFLLAAWSGRVILRKSW
jgi:hypothetical protein